MDGRLNALTAARPGTEMRFVYGMSVLYSVGALYVPSTIIAPGANVQAKRAKVQHHSQPPIKCKGIVVCNSDDDDEVVVGSSSSHVLVIAVRLPIPSHAQVKTVDSDSGDNILVVGSPSPQFQHPCPRLSLSTHAPSLALPSPCRHYPPSASQSFTLQFPRTCFRIPCTTLC
ncbi:hypothetical protein K438DRAFT_2024693 [Mycena galopus ATCC 62051]|nr:hypothetical protein K438DRAFT_2024693 [Mycena galopus ATCC 62051]